MSVEECWSHLPPNWFLFAFRPPIHLPNFSLIKEHICSYNDFCKVCEMTKKKEKMKKFYENLLTHVGNGWRDLIQIGMWPPLHGGELHCKFSAIWIRHHGATDVWSWLCCFFQYMYLLRMCALFSWVARYPAVCLDELQWRQKGRGARETLPSPTFRIIWALQIFTFILKELKAILWTKQIQTSVTPTG